MKENHAKPECVIMLTDGYVNDWGNWDVPVLWAITEGGTKTDAPVGKTIHMEE
jgi:hypothetical protein